MEEQLQQVIKARTSISDQDLHAAFDTQKRTREPLIEVLIRQGLLTRDQGTRIWAEAAGFEFYDLTQRRSDSLDAEMLEQIVPKEMAQRFELVPFDMENETIHVGVYDPTNVMAIDAVKRNARKKSKKIALYLANRDSIHDRIKSFYGKTEYATEIRKIITEGRKADTEQLMDLFLKEAIDERSTDIHISPEEEDTYVSYRIDGHLQPYHTLPKKTFHASLVSRIKVMSKLDIGEQRVPQDGNISYEHNKRKVDIRTSTSPTNMGENVVLRLLDKANIVMQIERLGLNASQSLILKKLSQKPHGIILATGPTGSGKTTTLYSMLNEIDRRSRNILTVEDPIEYRLDHIKQTQVNEKAGLVFSRAIRHFLRQDPDVILVGEIRDMETAKIAFQAAMTGHLVLSSVHTNDASSCISRLKDLGVENYLIQDSLKAVIAQQLVRRLCTNENCRCQHYFTEEEKKDFNLGPDDPEFEWRGKGCDACNNGFKGRMGIFEVLQISRDIKELIHEDVLGDKILDKAQQEGMRTMRQDGIEKVRAGITTMGEVSRVLG